MTPLPDSCTYWMDPTRQCGRQPIEADYFTADDVRGDQLVSSNCGMHDLAAARRYALAKGLERRTRRHLEAVPA